MRGGGRCLRQKFSFAAAGVADSNVVVWGRWKRRGGGAACKAKAQQAVCLEYPRLQPIKGRRCYRVMRHACELWLVPFAPSVSGSRRFAALRRPAQADRRPAGPRQQWPVCPRCRASSCTRDKI